MAVVMDVACLSCFQINDNDICQNICTSFERCLVLAYIGHLKFHILSILLYFKLSVVAKVPLSVGCVYFKMPVECMSPQG